MSVLITGASAGIGEATARIFAEHQENLILIARRKDRLENLAIELRAQHGVQVDTFACDLKSPKQVEEFCVVASPLLAQVKILINNAGLAQGLAFIQDVCLSDSDAMIDTNIKGLLAMTRAILPYFLKNQEGHIVNLGSVAGHLNYPRGNVYCATKAAVHALSECLRLDLCGTSIRVTEISPGMVETEFSEVRLGDRQKAQAVYAGMKPLCARDIAETLYWCVSRPPHVNIQEVVIYPTDQASPSVVHRK